MGKITNPILPGFHPDPSIVRVGEDYYIATSTFEWWPGILIYHSLDLTNWELIARPLNRIEQLDMKGNPSSGGVWAPCLSYDDGIFYLCYTDVKNHDGIFWNMHNYMVTANDIKGDWSSPVFLNSSGFDPSLFHDEDGKKYLLNRQFDYTGKNGGILIQAYDPHTKSMIGTSKNIFKGSVIGDAEGAHLYKLNGYYYLIVAEGGTGLDHCVTVARSKELFGPYEVDPQGSMLSSKNHPNLIIQKAGHADIVQTPSGEWYMVHLCGRPLPSRGRCILGRETCIQSVYWNEAGWLRLTNGFNYPALEVDQPMGMDNISTIMRTNQGRDDFNAEVLDLHYQTLRVPLNEHMSLTSRRGFLRLRGQESLNSCFQQSMVARRQQSFCYVASTCVSFEPNSSMQMAGLTAYYNTHCFYYLKVSYNEGLGKNLEIVVCDNDCYHFPLGDACVIINGWDTCHLRVKVMYDQLQFYYSKDGTHWIEIGEKMDASILSDEYIHGWAFTGAFVGMCCQDLTGGKIPADFDYFEYIEL